MENEISQSSPPVNQNMLIDYGQYVNHLYLDFPHLAPLVEFLNLEEPAGCVPDCIKVMDTSKDGKFEKEQFSTTGQTGQSQQLTDKLNHNSPDLETRVVCVSQLTPTSAKILGTRYNLSAEFLNSHLPGAKALAPIPSRSSYHINFIETYHLDRPFNNIFHGQKFSEDDIKHEFLLFAMVHQAQSYLVINPDIELITLNEDLAFFYVKQRMSIHISREGATSIGR